jgi:hypothetical protein
MIREKSMVIDGLFFMFGSSNFDARSSEINGELDVVPGFLSVGTCPARIGFCAR